MSESRHMYEGVVFHVTMSHVSCMNESCLTYECLDVTRSLLSQRPQGTCSFCIQPQNSRQYRVPQPSGDQKGGGWWGLGAHSVEGEEEKERGRDRERERERERAERKLG